MGRTVQQSSPTPPQETYPHLPAQRFLWEWLGSHHSIHLHPISCCAIPGVWHSGAGPIPQHTHLIQSYRCAIIGARHTLNQNVHSCFHACLIVLCWLVLFRIQSISTCFVGGVGEHNSASGHVPVRSEPSGSSATDHRPLLTPRSLACRCRRKHAILAGAPPPPCCQQQHRCHHRRRCRHQRCHRHPTSATAT